MFSGIIEHTAKILKRDGWRFTVENTFADSLNLGQSIAHDGACMTLTAISEDSYEFFVMEESLSVTNFGAKQGGDTFNVERSLKLWDRIDGHIVTGHIDTVWKVIRKNRLEDDSLILEVELDIKYDEYLIRKGSIAINGVSLTVVTCGAGKCSVSLIPLTQDWTNLSLLEIGDPVNLEFDSTAKYIAHSLKNYLQNQVKSI